MRVFSKFCRLSIKWDALLQKADMGEIESISPKEAYAMYIGQQAVIVDVREDIKNRITLSEF